MSRQSRTPDHGRVPQDITHQDAAEIPAVVSVSPAMTTSQQAHPRRIAPMRTPSSQRTTLHRQITQTRHLTNHESEATSPGNGRAVYGFVRRALVPISTSLQRSPGGPRPSREQSSCQCRRRPRSPSPIPRPSRRRRLTLTSEDTGIEVALPQAAASLARRPHAAGPEPEAEPVRPPVPPSRNPRSSNERLAEIRLFIAPNNYDKHVAEIRRRAMASLDSDEGITESEERLRRAIACEVAKIAPLLPLPSAPQAGHSRPPPHYIRRDAWRHPLGTDYDLTANVFRRQHNNGAPPLPLYTPVARPSERVLQFGGDEDEQRSALVRWMEEACCRKREENEDWLESTTWEQLFEIYLRSRLG
ncbi:hypothetical protein QBC32DRAFT_214063 [Pseudoneurospora amorphoporcata]|uniref:Uncharacterized protein n=1 Tax=Pseudoneurospora amorphoporcata TaxID=241081 RepID=A0AAN6NVF2_9PEZI|nr:hypothetical protein QBC32DRAFT_214063 [Pseudoneurospora amorphoporcata]